jgi:RNA polymerase sigma-70 factor (ECF subfamily)
MNIVGDSQTAEECENDTYLQAWNTIPPKEPRSYLFAFLARIIRHISIDCCRYRERLCRAGYVQELSSELQAVVSGKDDVESRMDAIMLGQSISAFLRMQPEMVRNVFIRRYWYLDSIDEICRRYSISQSKAKSILFRCRNNLRKHLVKEGFTL